MPERLTNVNFRVIIPTLHAHAAVAQLDRAPGFGPGGRGFESLWPHHVENCKAGYPPDRTASGRSGGPARPNKFGRSGGERLASDQEVGGSNPSGRTTNISS